MILQLSSGIGGPRECTYAVAGIFRALEREFPDIRLVDSRAARDKDCFTSITFTSEQDLSALEGTLLWVGQSPFRPHHKRKNWFVGCSVVPEAQEAALEFKPNEIRVERFHCGGKGGQNVNKVETGIRLIHEPTGIRVESTSERTQHANKRIAEQRLSAVLKSRAQKQQSKNRESAWREHGNLERGNPVRTYRGSDFKSA